MNIVQAIGRLRPSQRKPSALIHIFLPHLSELQCSCNFVADDANKQHLLAKGLLSASNIGTYNRIGMHQSIFDWATSLGCRIIALHSCFGISCDAWCLVCDYCNGTAAQVVAKTVAVETAYQNESEPYF